MGVTRRHFLHGGLVAGAAAVTGAVPALPRLDQRQAKPYFAVHPFIEQNPKAVFIRRTHAKHKFDNDQKRNEGLKLAREIFVSSDTAGIPVTHKVVLKPNVCSVKAKDRPVEDTWGSGTDPQFYEGMVMGLKEVGVRDMTFVEANNYHNWNLRGFVDINERHGIKMNECERRIRNFDEGYEMNWSKVPEPVVYAEIPHYTPVNDPNSWILNIAKWKAHGMCLTQSVKNEQGLVVKPYVRFCPGWNMVTGAPDFMQPNIHPKVEERVNRYFENHRKLGYARYDSPARLSPMHQEIWAHKTCDNMQVLNTGLAMIEGIYGRDGNAFTIGNDHLTNIVMFGKDKFRLDLIGLWLAGHEPGNVNLYRIAKERGLSDTFNPWEVPIYEWIDGEAQPRKLTDFERTPLVTYYLQKDGEPEYHLVDEPFDYDKVKV
jgi:uncharacterized protein (DUF362 family)